MSFVILIPARMKSTRLPNKPMADIEGLPMIVRVAERGRAAGADRVVVATDHEDIERVCREHGVEVVMTSASHPTGTDRLAEAVSKLGLADDEIVVNLQGDEPLMPVDVMQRVATLLAEHPDWAMTTAAHTMKDVEDFLNPNVVKVTCDVNGKALTFDSVAPRSVPRNEGLSSRRLRGAPPPRALRLPRRLPQGLPDLEAGADRKVREPRAAARPLLRL